LAHDQAQVTDADRLIVLAARTEALEAPCSAGMMPENLAYPKQGMPPVHPTEWYAMQAHVALGQAMAVATCLDVDACPLEEFDSRGFDGALGLDFHHSVVLAAFGHYCRDASDRQPPGLGSGLANIKERQHLRSETAQRLQGAKQRAWESGRAWEGGAAEDVQALTSREAEVLQLVAEGAPNKQIAFMLGISIKTVEKHRQQLMNKLGIHDTAGLTRYAIFSGAIESSVALLHASMSSTSPQGAGDYSARQSWL
jgi:DNA-binding CsgD family transcriptional regulator